MPPRSSFPSSPNTEAPSVRWAPASRSSSRTLRIRFTWEALKISSTQTPHRDSDLIGLKGDPGNGTFKKLSGGDANV